MMRTPFTMGAPGAPTRGRRTRRWRGGPGPALTNPGHSDRPSFITGQRRRIITVAGEGGTGPRKGFGAAAPSTKGESVPARAGTSAAYTADPQTGHVVAAPGISIPHAGHVFVPPAGACVPCTGGGGATAAAAGSFFRRRIRTRTTMITATRIAIRRPRYSPNSSKKVTSCQFAVSVFGPLIITVAPEGVIEVAPVQPATANFAPPTWTGDVTVTCAVVFSSYQQDPGSAVFTHVGVPYEDSTVSRYCFANVAWRIFGPSIVTLSVDPVPAGDHETNLNRTPLETTWGVTTPNTCSLFSSNHRSCDGLQGRVSTVTTGPAGVIVRITWYWRVYCAVNDAGPVTVNVNCRLAPTPSQERKP